MKGMRSEEKDKKAEIGSYFMIGKAIGFIVIWGLSIYSYSISIINTTVELMKRLTHHNIYLCLRPIW